MKYIKTTKHGSHYFKLKDRRLGVLYPDGAVRVSPKWVAEQYREDRNSDTLRVGRYYRINKRSSVPYRNGNQL